MSFIFGKQFDGVDQALQDEFVASRAKREAQSDCGISYFPDHDGLRFSANALRPSLASSVIAKSAIWLSV